MLALDEPHGPRIAAELEADGHQVLIAGPALAVVAEAIAPGTRVHEALAPAELMIVGAARGVLTPELVAACDRQAVRIVALASRPADARLAVSFGLSAPLPLESYARSIVAAAQAGIAPVAAPPTGRIIAVWGPQGAPGRTTVAVELAAALGSRGRRAALIDADTHAPSIAVGLGLPEESPGVAAACRRAATGALDAAELTRIAVPLGGAGTDVDVLTGLNRPSRWPELSAGRLGAVLEAARTWSPQTIVDVGAPLERDEEIVSDLEGPRRNAATLAALEHADHVIAVATADPVGIARFIRAHAELRALVGQTPVHVVVNRLRTGALGADARGQVRRALERFAGVADVAFLPHDPRAADAALLAARPVAQTSPRSALAQAVRRFAAPFEAPLAAAPADGGRGRAGERRGAEARRRREPGADRRRDARRQAA
ncbi:hypothetical protein A7J15_05900 [Microbacterium sediminis]|uniref:CobQ/CobB/MinD/ParA nucleotide binding domain-containing protein n=1 Tax=Microbacterium sediminis TaxID=904291 RepID=A0A1B9NCU1_9MICO|nr:hypothetical protein A7J15_05900 [Microbacterium sediminis]